MTVSQTLVDTIDKAAFRTAILLVLTGVLSAFFPLDAPEGSLTAWQTRNSSPLSSFLAGITVLMAAKDD